MFSASFESFCNCPGLQWNDPKTADVNLLLQDLSVVETHRVSENTCMTPLDIRLGLHNIFFCSASISKCSVDEIFPRGSNSFSVIDSITLGSL